MKPMIKWLTGKTNLLPEIKKYLPKYYNTYYEPLITDGTLLFDIMPQRAVISNTIPELTNLYECIQSKPDIVLSMLKHIYEVTDTTPEAYYEIRKRYNNKLEENSHDIMSCAMMLWLSKNCKNNMYTVNKKGLFNASFKNKKIKSKKRYLSYKTKDYANIWDISQYLKGNDITVINGCFDEVCVQATKDDFIFINSTGGDFSKILDYFTNLGVFIMVVVNDNTPEIRKMYKGYNILPVNGEKVTKAKKLIITNYEVDK